MKLSFFGRRLERIGWGSPVRTDGTSCAAFTISPKNSMEAVFGGVRGGGDRRNQEKIIAAGEISVKR